MTVLRLAARAAVIAAALVFPSAAAAQRRQPAATPPSPPERQPEVGLVSALRWRSIGPANMGGRTTVVVGIPGNRDTFYLAGADGGVHKTTNAGVTFQALFTDQAVYSVGALEIAPSDHNVLWLGSGEGDPRNSASFGNGVYRSTDAGQTWKYLGLDGTERIKRIAVDPRDPDVAYACALGHAWGGNEQRGVFRTADGGKTWQKVLYLDKDTGCSDIAMDAANARILYAGMWTFRRWAWHFDDGGGQTALYRTTDGGDTWTKLTNGLPKGPMARIGVATSRSDPSVVYLITETKDEGMLYRSDDRGDSWRMVNDDRQINFRPFYYSDVRVDPNDPNAVWSLSGGLYKSTDGGKTFQSVGRGVHGDHQALWIDPAGSNRVLSGSDGGFQVSYDGGSTWKVINNVALAQFYHVAFDLRNPYYICGGLQDNGDWCGPSRTPYEEGIRKDDWYTVNGGDGFYAVPILNDPNLVYSNSQGQNITLTDIRTGSSRSVHPYPKQVGSAGDAVGLHQYRFNWDSPIHLSPHDSNTVYIGGNVIFKSTNQGQSWEIISPDLTTNDPAKQQSSGGPVYVDNTAAEYHTTVITIAESPVRAGVIWAGTDDGNIQVTQDGGKTWTNVVGNIKGLPANSWVARIDASRADAATAYVAVDRHRDDDFGPYAYQTTDYGKTWTSLRGNLPALGYVQVVREDPFNPRLLYAGTELGIFASWDGGARWVALRNGLPPVSVRDIKVHPREHDLIIGTHGRGAFIMDDITALERLGSALTADAFLFEIRSATRWSMWGRDASLGAETYAAENPPYGALITYYLKADAKDPVVVTVSDASGKTIRTLRQQGAKAGINRIAWDLRYDGPRPAASERGAQAGGGGGGRFGFGGGPYVVPGEYTVSLKAAGMELKQSVRVDPDPRVQVAAADYQAQLQAGLTLRDLISQVNGIVDRTEDLKKQLTSLADLLKRGDVSAATGQDGEGARGTDTTAVAAVQAALTRVTALRTRLTRPAPAMGYRQAPMLREELTALAGNITRPLAPPTDPETLRLEELEQETAQVVAEMNAIMSQAVPELNRLLGSYPHVVAGANPR